MRIAMVLSLAAVVCRPPAAGALTGREVYEQACASCHGDDGRGAPEGSAITVPLPDFTDCLTSTAETTANWTGLVRHGGRFLGLSDQMPGFGDALTDAETRAVVDYVRTFCRDDRYPIGDLNYPRPVFVEKAYPEDEAVLSLEYESAHRLRTGGWEASVEKRVGPRGQIEVAAPGAVLDPDGGGRTAGVGDLELSWKQALVAAPRWRSIVSGRVALAVPTGDRKSVV